jgi:hypothetical protein
LDETETPEVDAARASVPVVELTVALLSASVDGEALDGASGVAVVGGGGGGVVVVSGGGGGLDVGGGVTAVANVAAIPC